MSARELLASGAGITLIDEQIITVSGNWTKVAGVKPTDRVIVDIWSAGGSGARGNQSDEIYGGQGGAHLRLEFFAFELPSIVACIIGAGGAAISADNQNGISGGLSSFGGFVIPGGGGGLYSPAGVAFGHLRSAEMLSSASPLPSYTESASLFPFGYSLTQNPRAPVEVGGFWSFRVVASIRYWTPAHRIYAGAVGGSLTQAVVQLPAGSSIFGGLGGAPSGNVTANAGDGQVPGGGGGAKFVVAGYRSGAGARGEIRVRVLRGAS